MEEMLGNEDNVRRIFDDWMTWNPKEHAWNAYLKFEQRHGSLEKCRQVLERFIDSDPTP
jgi:crooked neck